MVSPLAHAKSLDGFLRNFCAEGFVVRSEAGGLTRTAQIQPGVFYTLEAPFVRILALYSNTLEDPGYISGDRDRQLADHLPARRAQSGEGRAILRRAGHRASPSALYRRCLAARLEHPDAGGDRSGVRRRRRVAARGALGHAHNYQRFTRTRADGTQIPYVVCGNMDTACSG